MNREETLKRMMKASAGQLIMRGAAKFVKEKFVKPLIMAEVGVADGRNSVAMLKGMEVSRLYLIDSYPNYKDGTFIRKGELQETYYMAMFINLQLYLSKTVFITRNSLFASSLFEREFFDFVYIDSHHSYSSTKGDIEAWWPLVKGGGVLGGHDIGHVDYPGVAKAVEGFSRIISKRFVVGEGSDWWIEKV